MSNQFSGDLGPVAYEIRVQGHLGARWAAWFDGLSVTNEPDGTTLMCSPVTDQSALHGLLQKVRDLGLPLISITPVDAVRTGTATLAPERVPNPKEK